MSFKSKLVILTVCAILIIGLVVGVVFFSTKKEKQLSNTNSNTNQVANTDDVSPIIVLDDTYIVKTGYNKDLVNVIMSADDVDPNPKREIIGDYDLNTAGEYRLTYRIEDSSNNVTTKDFTLKVKDNYTYTENDVEFNDVLNNHKTEDTKIGIDVSKWQGEINWKSVADQGVEFAIIRMGYQNGFDGEVLIDPYFQKNITECSNNGISLGIYFSSYAKTPDEAKAQADWVKDNLNYNYVNLPVSFDWENWSSFNSLGLSLKDINDIANSFMDECNTLGYNPILYSSKAYLQNVWENPNSYPVWLANYARETNYTGSYKIWQLCQTGIIDGITGYVDFNVMY